MKATQIIQTIICEGDAIGAFIILCKDEREDLGIIEQKSAIIGANFLDRQMEG